MSLTPEMTRQQAEALAGFIVSLRPGQRSWTKAAVTGALNAAALISRDPRLVAVAAINVALDPKVRTPEVIGMPGRHWETTADVEQRREGTRAEQCPRCRDFYNPAEGHSACHTPAEGAAEQIIRLRDALDAAVTSHKGTPKEDDINLQAPPQSKVYGGTP